MKALSIRQPYASLIMIGAKPYEYRSTRTHYRGRIAIHAAKTMTKAEREVLQTPACQQALRAAGLDPNNLPRSCVLGTVEISGCVSADTLPEPHSRVGLFAWSVVLPRVFAKPVPAKGALSFWNWNPDKSMPEVKDVVAALAIAVVPPHVPDGIYEEAKSLGWTSAHTAGSAGIHYECAKCEEEVTRKPGEAAPAHTCVLLTPWALFAEIERDGHAMRILKALVAYHVVPIAEIHSMLDSIKEGTLT